MADMTITKGTAIFDTGSQSRVSVPFKVSGTIAITGFGLQADDEITFEIVELKEGTLVDENGCCGDGCATTLNKPPVNVVSATPILCCGCGCSTLEQLPRKLDKNNPRIFMDDMDGLTLRAVWNNDGGGFGTASVLRTSSQKTNLTAAEKGCCEELPKCPAVTIVATPLGPNSINVAVTSAEPVFAELNGVKRYINGGQSTVFTGLDSSTEYYATAENDCGAIASAGATTAACPAINLTQTANTTDSITVALATGGIASVFVGADEVVLSNGASHTFTGLTAGKPYTAKVVSACGNKASFQIATADCPAVDFTATALSATSLQVTAVAGMPLDFSIVSQGGAVLDAIDGLTSTIVFTDLPEGAIVTVKAVNECGKKKQLNVNLPDPAPVDEPFCASLNLKDEFPKFAGFAYFPEDVIDPAATVPFRGGFIYPTRGKGHTVKVTDALGAVIGYAANKSDCANPCCEPVLNLKKCGGADLTSADEIFTSGSLKTCVNGVQVPLTCDMIVKTIDSCCEPTVYVGDSSMASGYGVCISLSDPVFDGGKAVYQSRTNTLITGSGNQSPNSPTYFQRTYCNTHSCSALLEIEMQIFANAVADDGATPMTDKHLVFVHNLGEELNVLPISFGANGAPVPPNWAWTNLETSYPSIDISASSGLPFPVGAYSQQSNSLRYQKILAAGECVTLYGQWWAVMFDEGVIRYTIHGGFNLTERLFLNAGEF
jgi:hypothetical protein